MTDQTTISPKRPRRMARESKVEAGGLPEVPATPVATKPPSKASLVEGLLQQAEGASLADLCQATGWLPHTCRAFLTGLRKKGKAVKKTKREDGTTIYGLAALKAAA